MDDIATDRLLRRCMGPAFLRASLAGDRDRAEALIGAKLPAEWPENRELLEMRRGQLAAHPDHEPWLTRAMVLRDDSRVVGVTGFHGPPGGDWLRDFAPGGVEFGYTVYPEWRRRGLALEAGRALMAWATAAAGVTAFVLSIQPGNEASEALARRLGFQKVGSWEHEVRGTEHVYRRHV